MLVELHKNPQSLELKSFFQDILAAPCALLAIDQVYCEFLNYAKDKKDFINLSTWLEKIVPAFSPKRADSYLANQIYLAIKAKDVHIANRTSLVDRLLGAVMADYGDNLFLATTNHRDFPTFLYDRMYIFGFENNEGNIQNICIYRFNEKKFKELLQPFT